MPTRRQATAALLACCAGIRGAHAQDFPTQPVRLIVPFAAGGPADAIARLIGRVMGQRLGQPVVVESRSGAGGVVGVEAAARSRPDGHSIVLASTGALVILPHLMPRMPYDPLRDLLPIGQVLAVPQVMVVGKALPVATLQDFLAEARRRPRQITYGSAGNGSTLQMAAELLRLRAGIELTHVPYRGAAPAVTDLLAGQIDMMMGDIPVLLPHIRSNSVTALGVTAPGRSAALPEVPTVAEAGVPGVESDTWYGLLAPAGTPPDRIAVLHRALLAALEDGDTRRALLDQGGNLVGGTPEAFAGLLRAETAKWGEVVRAAGIRLE
ncbi:Bug family tripartite tricarboxylate transporter substrate binding protein [Plastoroseomonas hellenica]|uniref:Bug family tripartite tricarboxylate transporter substrate binding protein n=1 Tax=Plastoroseomonas hellenica TaxID=2687306 RepID=UPI001BA6AE66|nr:tripartite tricarboxylate transporter substrate binding protein [Plastoroseomonas hellenica]MBR0641514.1 tripartite tricarboxylate transporter substrate binding protein [Plastoroseomonas hellenica]